MKTRLLLIILLLCLLSGLNAWARPLSLAAPGADVVVYDDALRGDWQNWSWDTQANFSAASPVHSGASAIAVTYSAGWAGLQLGDYNHAEAGAYDTLRFWIHGGSSGGQPVQVQISNGADLAISQSVTPVANSWTKVEISLLGLANRSLYTLVWSNNSAGSQPVFYLDDIAFVNLSLPTPAPSQTPPPQSGPALSVDVSAGRHPISPYIYGINFGDVAAVEANNLPLRRWGGNHPSRYNWQINTSNTGMDWYYENIIQAESAEQFIQANEAMQVESLLTVPMSGWVAKRALANHPYDCGFKVSQYGAQQSVDPWDTDCGNGILPGGGHLTGNDPLDTSIPISGSFAGGWTQHLVQTFGTATAGGVRFYALDNEPMLWSDTHRDVHPQPASYDELRDRSFETAAALKAADPGAQILGPVLWGWTAYFWSALDWATPPDAQHANWWEHPQDRLAHGNQPFVEWYLQQMQSYEQAHSLRLLDYLDLHYYPQASGVALSGAGDAATQARRLRSTRSLWDPAYTDESWIDQPVYLIPRMRDWVGTYYPGTKLAITEYNWGALDHINGALAQAEVLGIFGREGLDLATLWGPPAATQPGMFAFRIYRNYDGAGGAFGDVSLQAASSDQEKLATYAAQRSADQALTLMVINKTNDSLNSTLSLSHFYPALAAQVYRYSAANPNAIVRLPDQVVGPAGFNAAYPAQSITLMVIPAGAPAKQDYLPYTCR